MKKPELKIIDKNKDKLLALCGKYNVDNLFVFGSVLNNRFGKSSDIDFIVNFKDVSVYEQLCR